MTRFQRVLISFLAGLVTIISGTLIILYSSDEPNSSIEYSYQKQQLNELENRIQNLEHKTPNNSIENKTFSSPHNLELTIPIIVAILGGLLAIYQVKMNIIKSARIKWIENLRDTLSHFISATSNIEHTLDLMTSDVDKGINPDKAFYNHSTSFIGSANESVRYATKISLYLNILEPIHKELASKIDHFIVISTDAFDKKGEERSKAKKIIGKNIQEIVRLSQKIIKIEWDRVSKSWVKRKFESIKNA